MRRKPLTADLFEVEPAGVMSAKQIRPIVEAWFTTKGLKLDESKLWPRMGSGSSATRTTAGRATTA